MSGRHKDEVFRKRVKSDLGDGPLVVIGVKGWRETGRANVHYDLDVRRVSDNAQFRVCACVMERTNVPCPFR